MIRGIGPVYAKKLVRAFGEAVFDVIEQEPPRLREVTGIGPKRAERIIAGWAEQKVIREIMLFLHSNGVGTSRAGRIYKTYGADAVHRHRHGNRVSTSGRSDSISAWPCSPIAATAFRRRLSSTRSGSISASP